jgi:hypothetical protein
MVVPTSILVPAKQKEFDDRLHQSIWLDLKSPRARYRTLACSQNTARVGDLPQTPFHEGDVVMIANDRVTGVGGSPDRGIVVQIDYDMVAGLKGGRRNAYTVQIVRSSCYHGQWPFRTDELRLIGRGRNQRHWSGHRNEIRFADAMDEARFEFSIMAADEIRNAETGNFGWTLEQGREAFRNNRIHFLKGYGSGGIPDRLSGWRLDDLDVAERLRLEIDPNMPVLDMSPVEIDLGLLTSRRLPPSRIGFSNHAGEAL